MKNIGTKSINMTEIMVYSAMCSTTIDKFYVFWSSKDEMNHYFFSLWYPLELRPFLISEDLPPSLILSFSQLKLIWTKSKVSPLFSLESFPNGERTLHFPAVKLCQSSQKCLSLFLFTKQVRSSALFHSYKTKANKDGECILVPIT